MATQTEQQRKAAARKAAATRKRNQARASANSTRAAARRTVDSAESTAAAAQETAERGSVAAVNRIEAVAEQAQRAVLIPVGATLEARDVVVDVVKPYIAGRDSAERELEKLQRRVSTNLRKYERRGTTARNRAGSR